MVSFKFKTMDTKEVILDKGMVDSMPMEAKATFVRKTYAHLAGAFLAFLLVESFLMSIPAVREFAISMTQGYAWLAVLGVYYVASTVSQKWALTPNNKAMQYAGLGLYVVAISIIFMPLLMLAMYVSADGSVLIKSFVTAVFLFVGLSAVVLVTKKDFSFLRSALVLGGMIAGGAIVAGILFGFNLGLVFSLGMVVLVGGSILYQTSQLLYQYHTSQYVAASLGLFASFMTLLYYIISIFSRD